MTVYSFSRLCIAYVLSVWLVTQMGYINVKAWASPINSGTYLFALPPIIGYIGGIAVRSSVHVMKHGHQHSSGGAEEGNGGQQQGDGKDGHLNRRTIESLNKDIDCQDTKCMSPDFMFSDQHSSISSGIGGALIYSTTNEDTPHSYTSVNGGNFGGHHLGIFDKPARSKKFGPDYTLNANYSIEANMVEKSLDYPETRIVRNLAKVYTNVNERQPKQYYDYENFYPTWSTPDNYEIIRKIGRGKYSEVFLGEHVTTGESIVIKVLKPVLKNKIQREVKILKNLEGGPNIIPLLDTVKDPQSRTKSLLFPFINKTDVRELINYLVDDDLRYYIYELLKAIEFTHSKGIMHRDIKPHNIAIDHSQRKLYLLDWGLAEFYHPHKTYNIKVASRNYKPPELLVNMHDYDYSLDMWSLGCLFAGLILNRDPFFAGVDNNDQLVQITKVLGTDDLYKYIDKYGLELSDELKELIKPKTKKNWETFIPFSNDDIAHPEAIDFLDKLLKYDPAERLTAKEAMNHPYFSKFHSNPTSTSTTCNK